MNSALQIDWYVARPDTDEGYSGPHTEAEIGEGLRNGHFSWADAVWNKHLGQNWRRLMDIPLFRQYQPQLPDATVLKKLSQARPAPPAQNSTPQARNTDPTAHSLTSPTVAKASKKDDPESEPDVWFLNYEGSKFGPLSLEEVCNILNRGKLQGNVLAWTEGMEKWLPLYEIPAFNIFFLTGKLPLGRLEKRKARRRPLVATIRYTRIRDDGQKSPNTYTGICRDISTNGMRINTGNVPNKTGMKLIVEVDPLDTVSIPYFRATAEVARISGNESFAVRFTELDAEISKTIQEFVKDWYAKPPEIELELETRK